MTDVKLHFSSYSFCQKLSFYNDYANYVVFHLHKARASKSTIFCFLKLHEIFRKVFETPVDDYILFPRKEKYISGEVEVLYKGEVLYKICILKIF